MLVHQGRWPKFSAISGVTPRGKLYIRVHEDTVATEEVIEFLQHLLRHIRRRPIMIFWDGGRPHRSDETRAFLRGHPRLEAHRFPGYSPELNPDETVWTQIGKSSFGSDGRFASWPDAELLPAGGSFPFESPMTPATLRPDFPFEWKF